MTSLIDLPVDIIRLIPEYMRSVDHIMLRGTCRDLYSSIPAIKCRQMIDAAAAGYINIIDYLVVSGQKLSAKITMYAAAGGHLSCLKYLIDHGCPVNDYAAMAAIKNGHLECIKYLHRATDARDHKSVLRAAANGHVHIMQWLNEFMVDTYSWNYAARYGQLEMLKWLKSVDYPNTVYGANITGYAAASGCIDVLEYLIECNFQVGIFTMYQACIHGNLEVVKWLHLHNCPRYTSALWSAKVYDRMEVVDWLENNGYSDTDRHTEWTFPTDFDWSQEGPEDWEKKYSLK